MDQTEKKMEQAEKRVVRYLKRKFKADAINVESVWPCEKSGTMVEGNLKVGRAPLFFHIMVGSRENILGWKVHPFKAAER